jgi:hypothetical protein
MSGFDQLGRELELAADRGRASLWSRRAAGAGGAAAIAAALATVVVIVVGALALLGHTGGAGARPRGARRPSRRRRLRARPGIDCSRCVRRAQRATGSWARLRTGRWPPKRRRIRAWSRPSGCCTGRGRARTRRRR